MTTSDLFKIENLFLVVLSLLFMLLRGRAKRTDHEVKKIVILRWTPHMGDVVYTTPMFSAVKKKYIKIFFFFYSKICYFFFFFFFLNIKIFPPPIFLKLLGPIGIKNPDIQ